NKLDLDKQVIMDSEHIIRLAGESGISTGKGPTGIAAAAIYISAMKNGKARTQKDVARVSGVTEVTIRNRYKEISKRLGLDDLE
ncbi:MAG TPA: transcription initiation factor IIB, partial [Ferroplasma sp.]|nr:transcription initiation factor IIB [Ferroplasma sp.]